MQKIARSSRATKANSRAHATASQRSKALRGKLMGSALESLRERTLMSAPQIDRIVARLAHQILEPEDVQNGIVLIGIRRGGEQLVRRLASYVEKISGITPAIGFLNINLYRDDDVAKSLPESEIHEDLSGKVVVIVDDVLYTGRTVRSALDA